MATEFLVLIFVVYLFIGASLALYLYVEDFVDKQVLWLVIGWLPIVLYILLKGEKK